MQGKPQLKKRLEIKLFAKEKNFKTPSTYWSNCLFNLLHLQFCAKNYLNYNKGFLDSDKIHVKHKKLTSDYQLLVLSTWLNFIESNFHLLF